MSPGSFWTQPAGESHITAAKGESIAYVGIDSGPYLVKPIENNFDNGKQPINISSDNIMWLNNRQASMLENNRSEIAFLWKKDNLKGQLIKIKSGFSGEILNSGNIFHAVIIKGELEYGSDDPKTLDPGSYFTSTEESKHSVSSANNSDCIVYIRTNGDLKVK